MDERNKRLAKNTMLLYSRMAISMVVSLFTSRVVLETLGFDDYGLYGVIGGIVTMFTFLNGAMNGASSRYITIELGRKDFVQLNKIFNVLFASHAAIALVVLVLGETVGLWFLLNKIVIPAGQETVAFWVYQISIISTLFGITLVPYSSMIIAHENMKLYAYVGMAEVVLRLLIVYLLLILPGPKLLTWALLGLAIQIGINIFYRVYVRNHYHGTDLHIVKDYSLYRSVFGFVSSDLIGNISVLAQGQGLNILLNLFFGPAVNAARSLAYSVQGITQQFSGNFLTAIRPQIIKLYGEGKVSEMISLMKQGSCIGFYLLWILVLPVMINAPVLLQLWLGKYPDYTVPFIQIILLISLVQILKSPRTMVFHALGKLKWPNIIIGTILVLVFPIAYIFLKCGFGPTSVFWITFIDILLTEFISVFILKKYVDFNITDYLLSVHGRCSLIAVISAIVPGIINIYYPSCNLLTAIESGCVCLISVAVTVWVLGLNTGNRAQIIKFIRNKFLHHA